MNKNVFVAAVLVGFASFASAQSVTEPNGLLADATGRTLYTFDKDAAGKSNCSGGCAAVWPPFVVSEGATAKDGFSIVTRDDGSKQWAYKSMPLYYFASDAKPGDTLGDGVKGVWHVVNMGKPMATAPASSTSYSY